MKIPYNGKIYGVAMLWIDEAELRKYKEWDLVTSKIKYMTT